MCALLFALALPFGANAALVVTLNHPGTNAATEDVTFNTGFTVTPQADVTNVVVTSLSPNVVNGAGLAYSQSGPNWNLGVTPRANSNGLATIQVEAWGAINGLTTTNFAINFVAVNDAPTNTDPASVTMAEDTSRSALVIVGDVDDAAASLQIVNLASSDTSLFPSLVVTNGSATARYIVLSPATNRFGTANITFKVTDGALTNSQTTFSVTVTNVNDAPTISGPVGTLLFYEDVATNFPITVEDVDGTTPTIFKTSSNPGVLPLANITATTSSVSVLTALNQNGVVTSRFTASDGVLSNFIDVVMNFQPVNDAPTVSSLVSTSPLNSTNLTPQPKLFSNVNIVDVDHLKPSNETLVVTVVLNTNYIAISGWGDTFSTTGTPAAVSAALSNLLYDIEPVNAPLGTNTFGLTVTVDDGVAPAVVTNKTITIINLNTPPRFESVVKYTIADTSDGRPFDIQVRDDSSEDAILTLSITQLSDTNSFLLGHLNPVYPVFTGTAAQIYLSVNALQYVVAPSSAISNTPILYRLTVTDEFGEFATTNVSFTLTGANAAPVISRIFLNLIRITDEEIETPFKNVLITDVDLSGQQLLRMTITTSQTNAFGQKMAQFYVSDDGTYGTNDTLVITNITAAAAQALARKVVLQPKAGAIPVGVEQIVNVGIVVTDSSGATASNSQTRVQILGVNGAPKILGLPAVQPLRVDPLLSKPFLALSVSDDDTNLTVSVSLDNPAKGSLTHTNPGSITQGPPGTYTFSGSPTLVSQILRDLQFAVSGSYIFPTNQPGFTTFTIKALDSFPNVSEKTMDIILVREARTWLVDSVVDTTNVVGTLRYAVTHAEVGDEIAFSFGGTPRTIRLQSTLNLNKDIKLRGPGANLLTISGDSDLNGVPNVRLFSVSAATVMQGLTLTKGTGITGGAIYVGAGGSLSISYCAITDSKADQWGGAIDVDGGQLAVDSCFFRGNTVDDTSGQGGGAISIYTEVACSIRNSTFAENAQLSPDSDSGGGALFIQNSSLAGGFLDVTISHCTFHGNEDAVDQGSSILVFDETTRAFINNSLFGGGVGRNLEVQAASIVSEGGNISDDNTRTILTQGGIPNNITLLNHVTDLVDTELGLAPLLNTSLPTASYPLLPASPAIGRAVSSVASVDQLGVIRDAAPDSGAREFNAYGRLLFNEFSFAGVTNQFIEMYVPNNALPVNLVGCSLRVNGQTIHTFPTSTIVQPGFGVIFTPTNTVTIPGGLPPPALLVVTTNSFTLTSDSLVQLYSSYASRLPVLNERYLGRYVDNANILTSLNIGQSSITLDPQFNGFAYVPHTRLAQANLASPGSDAFNTPFGGSNAIPLAIEDAYIVNEDDISVFSVLINDFDANGFDVPVIVDLSPFSASGVGSAGVTNSQQGAVLTASPSNTPLQALEVIFDPTMVALIQSLPLNGEMQDAFYYEIKDVGTGLIAAYQTNVNPALVTVDSSAHRLGSGDVIAISESSGYDGLYTVQTTLDDSFTISNTYFATGGTNGMWRRQGFRSSTQTEARVAITIVGQNDPPLPLDNVVSGVTETSIVRIIARPALAGSNIPYPIDPLFSSVPVILSTNIMGNDDDIDTDDDADSLKLVGVVSTVHAITGYAATNAGAAVVVHSLAHGLSNGVQVLISGYGGHPTYNGYQTVTVLDADRFTIPVIYVDDLATKGFWAILNDANRLQCFTDKGALVKLDLRADPDEDNIVFDASVSAFLNTLSEGELFTNTFYYAVEDSHDAVSLAAVHMVIAGVNDAPVSTDDPAGLSVLGPLVSGSNTLPQVLAQLDLMYTQPAGSGATNRANLYASHFQHLELGTLIISNLWITDEITPIAIPQGELTANDSDVDHLDSNTVASVDALSSNAAAVSLSLGVITYNPAASTNKLRLLARDEMVIDTFRAVITDSQTGGQVTSLVAVLVVGLNDTPIPKPDLVGTNEANEDSITVIDPVRYPTTNNASWDFEYDINGRSPDNRLFLVPASPITTIGGATVTIGLTNAIYDPTNSVLLNQLDEWQTYTDRFSYTVSDHSMIFASDDLFNVAAGGSNLSLNVLANDSDYTGTTGILKVVSVGLTLNGGVVTIATNGTGLVYTPPALFVGDDLFTYTLENSIGDRDSALVRVRSVVDRVNGDLRAANDYFTVAVGETVSLDVLKNDDVLPATGAGLSVLSIVSSTLPGQPLLTNGVITVAATSGVTQMSFVYEVAGGGSARSYAVTTVDFVNRQGRIDAQADAFSVLIGSSSNALPVLDNDALITASTAGLTISSVLIPPSGGTIATNASRTMFFYTPASNYVGVDSFSYLVRDGSGGTGTGFVQVAVGTVLAANDFYTLPATTNTPSFTTLNVLSNDRLLPNPEGTLTIISVIPSNVTAIGTMRVSGDGRSLEFAASNATGQLDFNYIVKDSSASGRTVQARATVAVVGTSVNANPDEFIVFGNSTAVELDVLANDISLPNINKTYSIIGIGTGANAPSGIVSVVNNRIVYTPPANFTGDDTFTYTMSDSTATDTAGVTVRILKGVLQANADHYTVFFSIPAGATNAAEFGLPVVLNDRLSPDLGMVISISGLGINDGVTSNAPSRQGLVTINPDGLSLTYRPTLISPSNYLETFSYIIADGTPRRSEALVSIWVQNRSNDLIALTADDAFNVARNSSNNVLDVVTNDFVKPGTPAGWSVIGVTPGAQGGATVISANKIRYSPAAGFVGMDTFGYTVTDNLGGLGTATVSVMVGQLPPVDDSFSVMSGTVGNLLDVVANDPRTPSLAVEFTVASAFGTDRGGIVSAHTDAVHVIYAPVALYTGAYPYVENFLYTVHDDVGGLTTGRVSVAVYKTGSDRSTTNVFVVVQGRNDLPSITNNPGVMAITDKQTIRPFTGVLFTEVDEQLQEVVDITVQLDNASKGILRNLGGFSVKSNGFYILTNVTAASATAQIRELIFDPTENRITVPTNEITWFTISIKDETLPVIFDTNSFVKVTAENDAPTIAGTRSGQTMSQALPSWPFASVTIAEVDDLTLQPLTITISQNQPTHGTLGNLGIFSLVSNGLYRATGVTASNATAALRLISFTASTNELPVSGSRTTVFTLTADDGFPSPVVDTNTSVVTFNPLVQIVTGPTTNILLNSAVGADVANTRDTLVYGVPFADASGANSGLAQIYSQLGSGTNSWIHTKQLLPTNLLTSDNFGMRVDLDGNRAVVADRVNRGDGTPGSVYIFERDSGGSNTWGLIKRIVSPDGASAEEFGSSVSLDGDTLIVGATDYSSSRGAIYVFERNIGTTNGWGLRVRRTATNSLVNAQFGSSVDLSGDDLLVGAPADSSAGTDAGAVFYLSRNQGGSNQWGQIQKIVSADIAPRHRFGSSISLYGTRFIAGSPDAGIQSNGTAHVFQKISGTNLWTQAQKLTVADVTNRSHFGTSVAMYDDLLLIGAPYDQSGVLDGTTRAGAAYLFSLKTTPTNSWTLQSKLQPPAGSPHGLFGFSLDLFADTASIGAPMNLPNQSYEGAVFMYKFPRFNNAPYLASPVGDQYAEFNLPYAFNLPPGIFGDPDYNDALTLTLTFTSGSGGLIYNAGSITGTTTQLGNIPVSLVATDKGGLAATNTFNIIVLDTNLLSASTRTLWLLANFGNAATNPLPLWLADTDLDGQINDQEYVFGGLPNIPDGSRLLQQRDANPQWVNLTFLRRVNDPALTYRLEATTNLLSGSWTVLPTTPAYETIVPVSSEFEQVTIRILLNSSVPLEQHRIKVTY